MPADQGCLWGKKGHALALLPLPHPLPGGELLPRHKAAADAGAALGVVLQQRQSRGVWVGGEWGGRRLLACSDSHQVGGRVGWGWALSTVQQQRRPRVGGGGD